MNKIMVMFQPFMSTQKVIVYINNEKEKEFNVDISTVVDTVKSLMSEYNIKDVDLYGSKNYLSKFQAEIGGTDYAIGLSNINIIER